ncbi:MAG: CoA pyrophosphatase [Planctomycetes bacterium]|nr:CoA pyrophosphatase [Planctomycetota bacterium]
MHIDPQQLGRLLAQADRPPPPDDADHRQAAVFVLLVDRERTNLMLIRRADRGDPWSNHIAFPGGHLEPGDADALAAAHRETFEEVGIGPDDITPLGDLGHYQTGDNRVDLHVYVGQWHPTGPLRVNAAEVAQVIEVPIASLLAEHHARGYAARTTDQLGHHLLYPLADTAIWGVTARILHHLLELIGGSSGSETGTRLSDPPP